MQIYFPVSTCCAGYRFIFFLFADFSSSGVQFAERPIHLNVYRHMLRMASSLIRPEYVSYVSRSGGGRSDLVASPCLPFNSFPYRKFLHGNQGGIRISMLEQLLNLYISPNSLHPRSHLQSYCLTHPQCVSTTF